MATLWEHDAIRANTVITNHRIVDFVRGHAGAAGLETGEIGAQDCIVNRPALVRDLFDEKGPGNIGGKAVFAGTEIKQQRIARFDPVICSRLTMRLRRVIARGHNRRKSQRGSTSSDTLKMCDRNWSQERSTVQ